ncbi:MAG: NUDIX domain-containing protein [Vicinamibacterales bacterium]
MATEEYGADRRYPARPIVGVGAAILVAPGDRATADLPDGLPAPWGVVLVKRRYEPLAGHWSLPGGLLEVGESLTAGVAREMLEETGLVVDVGAVLEVFDRIGRDADERVRHHYVLIDYLCRPRGGRLAAASDVSEVRVVAAGALAEYGVTPLVEEVVAKAIRLVAAG